MEGIFMMSQDDLLLIKNVMGELFIEHGIISTDATPQTERSEMVKYHVHKRNSDGRFCGTIRDENEKRRFFYGKSENEVIQKIKDFEIIQKTTRPSDPKIKTLNDFIYYWFKNYYFNSVGDTTYDRMESTFISQIKSHKIGQIELHLVTTDDLQTFINEKVSSGLSISSLDKIIQILRASLDQAFKSSHILRNPITGVYYSKMRIRKEKERKTLENEEDEELQVRTYSDNELIILKKCIHESWLKHKYYLYSPAIIFQLKTLLRAGELLGLKWSDIDFNNKVIYIKRGIVNVKERDVNGNYTGHKIRRLNPPKTKAGKRVIPLCADAIDALLELKNRYEIMGIKSKYVVCTLTGTCVSQRNYNRLIETICTRANIMYRSSHKFRITGITALVNNKDMPVTRTKEVAGHTNTRTTLGYVQSVLNDYDDVTRNAFQNI
jgi:integrase